MLTAPHPLDNPVHASLTGPHARFAERRGAVLRYPADVCPFLALPHQPSAADWAGAAALVGPGGLLPLAAVRTPPPAGRRGDRGDPGTGGRRGRPASRMSYAGRSSRLKPLR